VPDRDAQQATLTLHGKPVPTVFRLLGSNEDSATKAVGWGLAHSQSFLRGFLSRAGVPVSDPAGIAVSLQVRRTEGITDIELRGTNRFHIVVEAKRGWDPPQRRQLLRYVKPLRESQASDRRFVVLTQSEAAAHVEHRLGTELAGFPIVSLSWSQLARIAEESAGAERGRLRPFVTELADYLKEVTEMPGRQSNQVYVVALSKRELGKSGLSTINCLEKYRRYWFPATGERGYPKFAPNYIAFRYRGILQSVHHVDDYDVMDDPGQEIPELSGHDEVQPRFMLKLGPSMRADRDLPVRSGPLRDRRLWADIDLLFTCDSVLEAAQGTRERRKQEEHEREATVEQ
jgi:hypothetical protein